MGDAFIYVENVWDVGIQVSFSAEDQSAVRDGRFPVSKYSRTSLYIAGHLPHLDTSSNQAIKQPFYIDLRAVPLPLSVLVVLLLPRSTQQSSNSPK